TLGEKLERHFGTPQDIEWAMDRAGKLWLVQSRDITTLYPLPPDLPDPETDLRVLFSANVAQGVFQPITPMGLQTFRLLSSAFASLVATAPADPDAGVPVIRESGMRLWIDVTEALRDRAARELPIRALSVMEARSGDVMSRLLSDPRLAPRRRSPMRTRLRILDAGRAAHRLSRTALQSDDRDGHRALGDRTRRAGRSRVTGARARVVPRPLRTPRGRGDRPRRAALVGGPFASAWRDRVLPADHRRRARAGQAVRARRRRGRGDDRDANPACARTTALARACAPATRARAQRSARDAEVPDHPRLRAWPRAPRTARGSARGRRTHRAR